MTLCPANSSNRSCRRYMAPSRLSITLCFPRDKLFCCFRSTSSSWAVLFKVLYSKGPNEVTLTRFTVKPVDFEFWSKSTFHPRNIFFASSDYVTFHLDVFPETPGSLLFFFNLNICKLFRGNLAADDLFQHIYSTWSQNPPKTGLDSYLMWDFT